MLAAILPSRAVVSIIEEVVVLILLEVEIVQRIGGIVRGGGLEMAKEIFECG